MKEGARASQLLRRDGGVGAQGDMVFVRHV